MPAIESSSGLSPATRSPRPTRRRTARSPSPPARRSWGIRAPTAGEATAPISSTSSDSTAAKHRGDGSRLQPVAWRAFASCGMVRSGQAAAGWPTRPPAPRQHARGCGLRRGSTIASSGRDRASALLRRRHPPADHGRQPMRSPACRCPAPPVATAAAPEAGPCGATGLPTGGRGAPAPATWTAGAPPPRHVDDTHGGAVFPDRRCWPAMTTDRRRSRPSGHPRVAGRRMPTFTSDGWHIRPVHHR